MKLVDTRILGKPSFFHGKQTEWRDWSYGLQIFIGACDESLAATMLQYGKQESLALMSKALAAFCEAAHNNEGESYMEVGELEVEYWLDSEHLLWVGRVLKLSVRKG